MRTIQLKTNGNGTTFVDFLDDGKKIYNAVVKHDTILQKLMSSPRWTWTTRHATIYACHTQPEFTGIDFIVDSGKGWRTYVDVYENTELNTVIYADGLKEPRNMLVIKHEWDNDEPCRVNVLCNGQWRTLGDLGSSVGPHGESTGEFVGCETTTPITEIMGKVFMHTVHAPCFL